MARDECGKPGQRANFGNCFLRPQRAVDRPSPLYMDNEAARLLVADEEKQLPKFAKHVALAYSILSQVLSLDFF